MKRSSQRTDRTVIEDHKPGSSTRKTNGQFHEHDKIAAHNHSPKRLGYVRCGEDAVNCPGQSAQICNSDTLSAHSHKNGRAGHFNEDNGNRYVNTDNIDLGLQENNSEGNHYSRHTQSVDDTQSSRTSMSSRKLLDSTANQHKLLESPNTTVTMDYSAASMASMDEVTYPMNNVPLNTHQEDLAKDIDASLLSPEGTKILNSDSREAHDDNGLSNDTSVITSPTQLTKSEQWKKRALKWHLPLMLILGILIGALWPTPGKFMAKHSPMTTISIVCIFFASGLQLDTHEVKRAAKNKKAIIFGLISILALTPTLGFALNSIPLDPSEFSMGLAIFTAMPSTISSCIVLTASAHGNVALSLLFSVTSNLASVGTATLWVSAYFAADKSRSQNGGSLNAVSLLLKLVLTILVPLIGGKLLRTLIPIIASLTKKYKPYISVISSALLVLVPWMKVSESSDLLQDTGIGMIFGLFGLGVAIHIIFLVFNAICVALLRMNPPEGRAVVIAASQKTLGGAVAVIASIPSSVAQPGLLLLPAILGHFAQIIVDAFLSSWYSSRGDVLTDTENTNEDNEQNVPIGESDIKNQNLYEKTTPASPDVEIELPTRAS